MALGLLAGSRANAGFDITWTSTDVGQTTEYYLRAINDGNTTGTKLLAYDLIFDVFDGRAYFRVIDEDGNGIPDGVDLPNATSDPGTSFFRVGSAGASSIFFSAPVRVGEPNPWTNGLSTFNIGVYNTTVQPPVATDAGTVIARLVLDSGSPVHVIGQMGGEVGTAADVEEFLGVVGPHGDVRFDVPSSGVVINLNDPGPHTFSFNSSVRDLAMLEHPGVSVTTNLPDFASLSMSPGDEPFETNFSITTTRELTGADYGLYNIDLRADAAFDVDHATLIIRVTPEPSTLAWLGTVFIRARGRRGDGPVR